MMVKKDIARLLHFWNTSIRFKWRGCWSMARPYIIVTIGSPMTQAPVGSAAAVGDVKCDVIDVDCAMFTLEHIAYLSGWSAAWPSIKRHSWSVSLLLKRCAGFTTRVIITARRYREVRCILAMPMVHHSLDETALNIRQPLLLYRILPTFQFLARTASRCRRACTLPLKFFYFYLFISFFSTPNLWGH